MKAATTAMMDRHTRRVEAEMEALGLEEDLEKVKQERRRRLRVDNDGGKEGEGEEEKGEDIRVHFKDFEKWYLEYFKREEGEDEA